MNIRNQYSLLPHEVLLLTLQLVLGFTKSTLPLMSICKINLEVKGAG